MIVYFANLIQKNETTTSFYLGAATYYWKEPYELVRGVVSQVFILENGEAEQNTGAVFEGVSAENRLFQSAN